MDLVADHTVLSVVVGSRAYGLDTAESDTDRRGVYAAPAALFWRLDKPPTHLDGPLPEQFSWELERFLTLALACNPTVLECLWYLKELVAAKKAGEHGGLPGGAPALDVLAGDVEGLTAALERARDESPLPGAATAADALHDLVVRVRLDQGLR